MSDNLDNNNFSSDSGSNIDIVALNDVIRKHALDNALKYDGKASMGAVIGKVIAELPAVKKYMKTVSFEVGEILSCISSMSLDDMRCELKEKYPQMLEEKERVSKESLKSLDAVDPKTGVIMRFAPSPSGPMHIGHAITGGLTSLYVKKYGGKFILRIEDTNSDNIDVPSYDLLPKDAEWLFGNVSEVWVQSDRMDIYYRYAEKFISIGACYVCTCSQEKFKGYADTMSDCPCRNNPVLENMSRWRMMFDKEDGFKEGGAVLRFKTSMQHTNPAMRDFPLARINDSKHPRQGYTYRVWPLMNLSVCVDDIEAGMTHIIRAKDHADNAKRQEMMYDALGIKDKFPKTYFLGKYNFDGIELSASKTRAKIEKGIYWGWDDIRAPFLLGLRRKGYQPNSFLHYTMLTGLSPVDKSIPAEEFFKILNSFNKDIIDPKSKRFFMMHDYECVVIHDAPVLTAKLKYHPDDESHERLINTEKDFLIMKSDLAELKDGNLYRLMDCLNFRMLGNLFEFDSLEYEKYKSEGKKIMHWLPAYGNIDIEILMDDASTIKGVAEHNISQLKIGDIVQFERFGFCRLDSIEENKKEQKKVYKFWFTHK
jgi:glutamyl-tRNA synthetase